MKKYNSTSSSPLKSGLGVLRPKPLSKIFVLSKEDRERIERDKANIQRVDNQIKKGARKLADSLEVDVRYYSIIYEAVDEVKAALGGLLSPEQKENILGLVEVRETFKASKIGTIAGCFVLDGIIRRDSKIRILRDNVVTFDGELSSLKRFKDDTKEVKSNFECGLSVKNFNDIKVGDQIEVYEVVEVARKL